MNIAIVGNSPCILNKEFGSEIDGHDIVIRFNDFVTKGYEKYTGTKTTMIVVANCIVNCKNSELAKSLGRENVIFRDDKFEENSLNKVFNGLLSEDDVTRLNFSKYYIGLRKKIGNYKDKHYPSSGLIMMEYILDKFPEAIIDVYGFSFFKDKTIHFYDNLNNLYHDGDAESRYFFEVLNNKINYKI